MDQGREGRIYLFGFPNLVANREIEKFFENWVQHKKQVKADWEMLYEKILVVREIGSPLGGCAVDQLYRWAKGCGWSRDRLFYLDGEMVESVLWENLPAYSQEGRITQETQVVDLTVCTRNDWEQNRSLLKRLGDTSYSRFLMQKV